MPDKIELILHQREFICEGHKAHLALLLAGYHIHAVNEHLFNKHGITSHQFNVLRILRGQFPKPSSILLIKERIIDKASDVSRLVERLRKAGFLNRCKSTSDRRFAEVVISEKGLSILADIDRDFTPEFFKLGDLTDIEIKSLIALIERIFK